MASVKKKIGEILIENGAITDAILNEALSHQRESGTRVTEYLIMNGFINEKDLIKSIVQQFKLPYLPLNMYRIPDRIIELVPAEIAKKYWLLPIDKIENILTVVMANPFDIKAIKELQTATGCIVQPFIGLFSDIQKGLHKYYNVDICSLKIKPSIFIDSENYKGIDRRKATRHDAAMDIYLSAQFSYEKGKMKNLSVNGILFESEVVPVGSRVILQIDHPEKPSCDPIIMIARIARVIPRENRMFDIGVELTKVINGDIKTILKYVRKNKKEQMFSNKGDRYAMRKTR